MQILKVVLLGALALGASAGVSMACPASPGTSPGWTVQAFALRDQAVVRGGGMFGGDVLDAGTMDRMPRRFQGLAGIRPGSDPVNVVMGGQFVACQDGDYNFTLTIEAGRTFGDSNEWSGLHCWADLRQGNQLLFSIAQGGRGQPENFQPGVQRTWSGRVRLGVGVHPLRLRLACAPAAGSETVYAQNRFSENTGFDLRVMGPSDRGPRSFTANEIFQLN
jgi:hypothetical protein